VIDTDLAAREVSRTHTLLIAAEDRIRRQFAQIMTEKSYFLLEAATYEDVMQLAHSARPDLILLADSPTLDAMSVCRALTSDQASVARIPVVMLLQSEDETLIGGALANGASDYISYPIKASILRQRVRFLLRMRMMQADLLEKEERYRIISTSISDYAYAFRVTPEGELLKEWNTKAFERITGYDASETSESALWQRLVHPEDTDVALGRYQRLLRGEKDTSEFRIITKTGEVRWLQDTAMPIWDSELKRAVYIYGAATDITDRKRADEMMRRQTEQLRTRNEELDAFAHTVAHNLKNSIAEILGPSSLAFSYYDRMDDVQRKQILEEVIGSTYKARDVIDSILLLAGVNRQQTIEIGPLDMQQVIEDVKHRMQNQIRELNAILTVEGTLPRAIGYAPWVEEIWSNYLSNALKYGGTPPQVTFGGEEQEDGHMRFWVQDNGPGLTDAEREVVFTPFTRLSQAKIDGHGLGLSVVQRIVQRLGGQVGVDSTLGEGARFWFTLPAPMSFMRQS
jgi:PAS domain S-box-containing protein